MMLTDCGGLSVARTQDLHGSDEAAIRRRPFGKTPAGDDVHIYTLINRNGLTAEIMTFGATLLSLSVPDRNGVLQNVVLRFDNLAAYLRPGPYYGATVGRFCNRIAGGRFVLDDVTYELPINNGPNSLHGGRTGFDKRLWTATPIESREGPSLVLTYISEDGEEGYPGRVTTRVTYTLHDDALAISFAATTSRPTIINLTNHAYFNLSGDFSQTILGDMLQIDAGAFTPVDDVQIPTGAIRPVAGTPFDFRTPHSIGERIDADDDQIARGAGYDHNWVLDKTYEGELAHAAVLTNPASGRIMDVLTTEPGLQVYTANFLDGQPDGTVFARRTAVCLETQHFPDAPNKPNFPTTVLRPGKMFESTTIFRFRAE
jgi:aldose 1-epimerase